MNSANCCVNDVVSENILWFIQSLISCAIVQYLLWRGSIPYFTCSSAETTNIRIYTHLLWPKRARKVTHKHIHINIMNECQSTCYALMWVQAHILTHSTCSGEFNMCICVPVWVCVDQSRCSVYRNVWECVNALGISNANERATSKTACEDRFAINIGQCQCRKCEPEQSIEYFQIVRFLARLVHATIRWIHYVCTQNMQISIFFSRK